MTNPRLASATIVRPEERGFAAAAHLLGAIPLWGFLFLAAIWIYFKERSREVVFHVQQAMVFQIALLGVVFFALAIQLLSIPVRVINQDIADVMNQVNTYFIYFVYIIYAGTCLFGMAKTYLGQPFLYPFFGRQVLEGSLDKTSPEG